MASDNIQTLTTAVSPSADSLLPQRAGLPVSADTLQRWTRAVTIPQTLPPLPASILNAGFKAGLSGPRGGDAQAVPRPMIQSQQSPAALRADSIEAKSSDAATTASPSPLAFASTGTMPAVLAFSDAMQQFSASTARALAKAPLSTNDAPFVDERLELNDMRTSIQAQGLGQRDRGPSSYDAVGSGTTAPFSALDALPQADGARALPLSTLRDMHAHHRQSRVDAASFDGLETQHTSKPSTLAATADLLMPRLQADTSLEASKFNDGVSVVRGNEQLHALIESCCSRLWVNDGGGGQSCRCAAHHFARRRRRRASAPRRRTAEFG
jgi:hypothetical protein